MAEFFTATYEADWLRHMMARARVRVQMHSLNPYIANVPNHSIIVYNCIWNYVDILKYARLRSVHYTVECYRIHCVFCRCCATPVGLGPPTVGSSPMRHQ